MNQLLLKAEKAENKYQQLCRRYFAKGVTESIWLQNRAPNWEDPIQGFKLHISSSLCDATEILEKSMAVLNHFSVMCKIPKNLGELKKLNMGMFYGYSQIGKFITVYPYDEKQGLEIAKRIHSVTQNYMPVIVPFDNQFMESSNVFYRYGSFIKNLDKLNVSFIEDPNGKIWKDKREYGSAIPSFIKNPFPVCKQHNTSFTNHIVLKALSKRGKGGVYLALKYDGKNFSDCIIKEGLCNGEMYYDNWDGLMRIRYEMKVLENLSNAGISVPTVYESFKRSGNMYIVLEKLPGINLYKWIKNLSNKITFIKFVPLAIQLTETIIKIHQAGYIWRDCKPMNFIYNDETTQLRPIDFEGVVKKYALIQSSWSSPGFTPPEDIDCTSYKAEESFDAYSMGATLFFVITGKVPLNIEDIPKLLKIKREYPRIILESIAKLLAPNPAERIPLIKFHEVLLCFGSGLSKSC